MSDGLTVEERTWAESPVRALRNSESSLDAVTAAKLRAARARAVAAMAERGSSPWLLAAPAALAAAVLAWTLLPNLALTPASEAVNLAGADAFELMTDEQGPEFYQNLDLYLWLEDQGQGGGDSA